MCIVFTANIKLLNCLFADLSKQCTFINYLFIFNNDLFIRIKYIFPVPNKRNFLHMRGGLS